MKRYAWFLILTIIFFSACNNSGKLLEEPTIDQEKMAQIATDLHIIEAHLQNAPAKQRDSIKSLLYHQVYKIHNIDSTELLQNQKIYYQQPEMVEAIYGRILELLDEKEKKLDAMPKLK
ncbi:MAG: DUF4296 domain-containing protein [Saprospiraceae bacterium]